MKASTNQIYEELFERYPALNVCRAEIMGAYECALATYLEKGTVFCCGNGGSSSDSEHIVGELLKSFKLRRAIDEDVAAALQAYGEDGAYLCEKLEGSLAAVSLISQTGVLTAYANDRAWDAAMAQQLYGLGRKGDCLFALSTSGNSKNCVLAVMVAKAKGLKTVGFTGVKGGRMKELCDVCIAVPEMETYKVQELHLPVYHCICAMLEMEIFG